MNRERIDLKLVMALFYVAATTSVWGSMEPVILPYKNKPANKKIQSKHHFFGFMQIGVQLGRGAKKGKNADMGFEADRIRLGWKYFSGSLAGKVFLDFAKKGNDNSSVGIPDLVKDAFIAYKFNDDFVVKVGAIKTPVGMNFSIPGWNLDVIKRGFDKKLAFERALGVMISGRDMGFGNRGKVNGLEMGHERPWKGFGYDLMITSATGRSGAVNAHDEKGYIYKANQENGYMGRLMFDWSQVFHAEVSYGKIKGNTNGSGEDYKVLNFGMDSHFERANVKVELYSVYNIRGIDGWDMNTLALTGTYYLTDRLEFAVKNIRGKESFNDRDSDMENTYIGLNYYINPKNNNMNRETKRARNKHRMQINYVYADVDREAKGAGALFRDNVVLL